MLAKTPFHELVVRKDVDQHSLQSQKMEALGRLAGGVAHDFNNLLTIINGCSDLLLQAIPESGSRRELAQEIQLAGQRATRLTSQLLAFARRQPAVPIDLNLNQVVTGLEKMIARLLGADVELITALADDLANVRADLGQIEQVIVNLVANARSAMPSGGRLTISTENVELAKCPESTRSSGSHVRLTVRDTGSGIPDHVLPHLFEPFFTTREKGKGTGLGLATVYSIVQDSHGFIDIESQVEQGTAFHIHFPSQVAEDVEVGELKSTPPAPPSKEGEKSGVMHRGEKSGSTKVGEKTRAMKVGEKLVTLLVVEDEEQVRSLACRYLEGSGYRVLSARDGAEALMLQRCQKEPIGLLVTDVVMPRMSGPELARQLRRNQSELPVLFMSGYVPEAIAQHGVPSTHCFLQKPFNAEDFVGKVREALDGK